MHIPDDILAASYNRRLLQDKYKFHYEKENQRNKEHVQSSKESVSDILLFWSSHDGNSS